MFWRTAMLLFTLICIFPDKSKADSCDALAAKVIAMPFGVTFDRRTNANIIILRDPLLSEMSITCPASGTTLGVAFSQKLDVSFSQETAYPNATFYYLAGNIGEAVIGVRGETIEAAAMKCQQAALRSSSELADRTYKGVTVECQAYTRDGGGTSITVHR
jgi:hypothetical protein